MGKVFDTIDPRLREFIGEQKIFFVSTAAAQGRVNLSPKDGASLRVLSDRQVAYLDQTGSGNETAAHIHASRRLTLMFCAFRGAPMILRLYGHAAVLCRRSDPYAALLDRAFQGREPPGARQIIVLDVERVQTSCGFGVPMFDYAGPRETLQKWALAKGESGLEEYRRMKNTVSIDGLPTGIEEAESGKMEP